MIQNQIQDSWLSDDHCLEWRVWILFDFCNKCVIV